MFRDSMPGARILIVEDEPEFASLMALWVERHGWRPEVVHDGEAAVRAFETRGAGPGPPRHQPPAARRLVGDRADPGVVVDADPPGHRARRRAGQDPRASGGRGRLRDEAALVPGTDGADRGGPPAGRRVAGPGRAGGDPGRGAGDRRAGPAGDARRGRRPPDADASTASSAIWRSVPTRWSRTADLLAVVWGTGYREDFHLLRVTMRNLRARLSEASPDRRLIATSYGVGYRLNATE